jgi:hypothetical protein
MVSRVSLSFGDEAESSPPRQTTSSFDPSQPLNCLVGPKYFNMAFASNLKTNRSYRDCLHRDQYGRYAKHYVHSHQRACHDSGSFSSTSQQYPIGGRHLCCFQPAHIAAWSAIIALAAILRGYLSAILRIRNMEKGAVEIRAASYSLCSCRARPRGQLPALPQVGKLHFCTLSTEPVTSTKAPEMAALTTQMLRQSNKIRAVPFSGSCYRIRSIIAKAYFNSI